MPKPGKATAATKAPPAKGPKAATKAKAPVAVNDGYELEEHIPEAVATITKAPPKPRIAETPLFYWTHREDAYILMCGRVVPRLSKCKVGAVGVNGVGQATDGSPLPKEAIASAIENGAKIIPWDVDGPGTSYIRRPKGMPGVHLSRFERCYPGSVQIDSDSAAYVAWLEGLVARGILPECPLRVLQTLHANKIRELDDLLSQPHLGATSHLARLKAEVAALEAAVTERTEAAEPAETEIVLPELPADPPAPVQ